MQDQLLVGFLTRITQSLENIDKTLSEPKDASAWRVAANRRISKAMDYIAKLETELDTNPLVREIMAKTPKTVLRDIREILTER